MTLPESSPKDSWLNAWHVNPSVNRDYDFIDGLRGIAILMVLCCHHIYVNPKAGPVTQFLGSICFAASGGVVLFFAISGFLISWPFWKRKFARAESVAPPGYARRRFWKIYPPLALSIVILTPVYVFLNHDWSFLPIAAKWLVGIPFFLPVSGKLNPVMWTLVLEVQFYIVLPLVFVMLKKVPARACLWIVPLIFFLVPVTYRAGTGLNASFYPDINPHFPSALDAFCLGILVAGLDTHGPLGKKWALLGMAGLFLWPVTLLLIAWTRTHPAWQGLTLDKCLPWMEKIASGCLLCYVANPKCAVARLLCAPWLRWCGIISYEWYLFHQPIVLWARDIFGPAGGNVALYVAIVGGSFLASGILSALIYRCFSLPILQYGRGRK
jgi:peptidoglycan/LPS O-acetylase OafA/YrhL